MAPENSIESLLAKLTTSLESVAVVLPGNDNGVSPQDGISLLDVKTELLLSYMQNLVFLILVKIRTTVPGGDEFQRLGQNDGQEQDGNVIDRDAHCADEVVKKLVELRVYMEKGVKPLENKLKYQIDKVLRAADTATRNNTQKQLNGSIKQHPNLAKTGSDDSESESDVSSAEVDELSYRPNPAAFSRPVGTASVGSRSTPKLATTDTAVYKPPRITPTALPTTIQSDKRVATRKPQRSTTIDDYIATELSAAPVAEPSIGSTIISGGRRTQSAKDRQFEDERRAYEETNFVRLAPESKKDRLKRGGGDRRRDNIYGGEEMAGLGAGVDRISRLTSTKRKGRMTEDGPRGEGFDARGGKRRKRDEILLQAKLKVHLKLSISRLRIVQQKDQAVAKQQRRAMAGLLEQGKHASARIRVENIIRSDLTSELHEILELYCELLLARIGLLESPQCDPGLAEAVRSILYAAPRTDVKELNVVRILLTEKFGKEFAAEAARGEGVEERVRRKLRVEPPEGALVESYLRAIAAAYDVKYGDDDDDDGDGNGDGNVADESTAAQDDPNDDETDDGAGGGAKEPPIPASTSTNTTQTHQQPLTLPLPAAELKTKTMTPPRNLGPKSPVSVAPPSPSTDNANPRLRLPGVAGGVGGGKGGGSDGSISGNRGGSGASGNKGGGKVNGAGAVGAGSAAATTGSKAAKPEGEVPDVDDLEKRFALLKK